VLRSLADTYLYGGEILRRDPGPRDEQKPTHSTDGTGRESSMSAREDARELVAAAASVGGDVALEGFRSGLVGETKGGAERVVDPEDVVTTADRRAQRRIIERIREERSVGVVVGEEEDEAKTLPDEGLAWVVDPIDGTYNYVRDMAHWASCVAAVRNGKTLAAATVLPALDDRFVVGPDGATFNGRSVSVSDRADPATFVVAPIALPPYGKRGHVREGIGDLFERFGDVRRIGSIQITLALIASGALDGTVTASQTNPWDTVGGVHLVRQAGGTVTDIDGDRWTPESRGLVASNGTAHEKLLAVASRLDG
jgi:myo-inositol-1(or 4)-monophosphatase